MTRWLETDSLSNQDIHIALEIGSYTANADRRISVQFFADQVAGDRCIRSIRSYYGFSYNSN